MSDTYEQPLIASPPRAATNDPQTSKLGYMILITVAALALAAGAFFAGTQYESSAHPQTSGFSRFNRSGYGPGGGSFGGGGGFGGFSGGTN